MSVAAGPSLEVLPTQGAVASRGATLLAEALLDPRRPPTGLATGRTMLPLYGALRPLLGADKRFEPSGWRSFNLDEYVGLAPRDSRSFAGYMAAQLGDPLGLAPGQLALPNGLAPDPAAEAERYRQAVLQAGLGLQLLGLGNNGHVGFNEPPCLPEARCRCLELSDETRRQNATGFGGDPAAVPPLAITLGLAEILGAQELLLVVTGAAKAQVLRRVLEEPPHGALPASWLQGHGHWRVLCDREAASALT
jgi:glucosamine-6-phosphate deaminase